MGFGNRCGLSGYSIAASNVLRHSSHNLEAYGGLDLETFEKEYIRDMLTRRERKDRNSPMCNHCWNNHAELVELLRKACTNKPRFEIKYPYLAYSDEPGGTQGRDDCTPTHIRAIQGHSGKADLVLQ